MNNSFIASACRSLLNHRKGIEFLGIGECAGISMCGVTLHRNRVLAMNGAKPFWGMKFPPRTSPDSGTSRQTLAGAAEWRRNAFFITASRTSKFEMDVHCGI